MSRDTFVRATGEEVQAAGEEAAGLLREGATDASTARVRVVDTETGRIGTMDTEEARGLLDSGRIRIATAEENDEVTQQRQYGDRGLETAALAALDTVTLGGVSDRMGDAGVSSEMTGLRERNEGAALAGDLLGSTVLGAGAGQLFGGLRAAGLAGRALAGVAEGAAGAGAETLARLNRESALGDPNLTAQEVLGQMGMSALLGGALGGAVDLGLGALGSLGRGLARGGARGGRASREAIERLVERTTGRQAQPGVADLMLEQIGRRGTAGIGADDAAFVQQSLARTAEGRALREAIDAGDAAIDDMLRPMRQEIDDLMQITEATSAFAKGELKRGQIRRLVDEDSLVRAADDVPQMLSVVRRLAADIERESALPGGTALTRRLAGMADDAERRLVAAAESGGRDGAADAFIALDQLKRRLGQDTARVLRSRNAGILGSQFEEAYEVLRQGLERGDVWGKAAAGQREINAAWHQAISNGGKFRRSFLTDLGENDGFARLETADPKKLRSWLQQTGTAVSDVYDEVFERFARTQADLNAAMAKHLDLPPEVASGAARARQVAEAIGDRYREAQRVVGARNQFNAASTALGERDSILGAALSPQSLVAAGGFIGLSQDSSGTGAVAGAGLGAALMALRRPDKVVRIMAAMERMRGTFRQRLESSSRELVESAARTTGRSRVRESLAGTIGALSARELGERFDKNIETLKSVEDPAGFAEQMAQRVEPIADAAPESAAQMVAAAARAAAYLNRIIPPLAHPPVGTLGQPETTPSQRVPDYQQRQFLMAAQVIEDPLSVLQEASRGTLDRVHIDALREVYPELHGQFVQRVVEDVADRDSPLPYTGRVSISLLVDVPTDPTLTGDYIARQQAGHAQTRAEPDQGGGAVVTPGNAQAPEVSSMAASGAQALAERRAG